MCSILSAASYCSFLYALFSVCPFPAVICIRMLVSLFFLLFFYFNVCCYRRFAVVSFLLILFSICCFLFVRLYFVSVFSSSAVYPLTPSPFTIALPLFTASMALFVIRVSVFASLNFTSPYVSFLYIGEVFITFFAYWFALSFFLFFFFLHDWNSSFPIGIGSVVSFSSWFIYALLNGWVFFSSSFFRFVAVQRIR